ncbi:MAG TPA: hypothetical protein VGA56_20690 [Opitutaceae bacterium]
MARKAKHPKLWHADPEIPDEIESCHAPYTHIEYGKVGWIGLEQPKCLPGAGGHTFHNQVFLGGEQGPQSHQHHRVIINQKNPVNIHLDHRFASGYSGSRGRNAFGGPNDINFCCTIPSGRSLHSATMGTAAPVSGQTSKLHGNLE